MSSHILIYIPIYVATKNNSKQTHVHVCVKVLRSPLHELVDQELSNGSCPNSEDQTDSSQ